MMPDYAVPLDEQYLRKVGHTFSMVLFHQLTADRKKYFLAEMQKVIDEERAPITDKELFPDMDIGNPEILY